MPTAILITIATEIATATVLAAVVLLIALICPC
jgi:hypothetical protein